VWSGLFASSIGTWMQNFTLAAFAWKLTHSTAYVGLLGFAQLGPLLFLSTFGGVLADIFDRKRLLVAMQLEQLVGSFVLAWLAHGAHPSKAALFLCVLGIGVGNALNAPAMAAILPNLVPRRDLQGAVSLQSVQMNASRVVGPAVAGLMYHSLGAAAVFATNAVTYLFAVAALLVARYPTRPDHTPGETGLRRLASGFRTAWQDRLVRRILITMATFSFFSLSFIYLMPALAADNLHMDTQSLAYGLLFAGFALGAASGALSIGTFLVHQSKPRIVRVGLAAFGILLAAFALTRQAALAYPVAIAVGFAYFSVVTSLSTILQARLDDAVRGRVMALWMMAFGGTVPVGVLVAGAVADVTSITAIVLTGAAVALALAWYADLVAVGAPAV
jgi:MFS family permease